MKASEVITRLSELIDKHGDLEIALYADHEPAQYISYNPDCWIVHPGAPAFEFNGGQE